MDASAAACAKASRRLRERNLEPWDIAARQILVREVGGTISGIEGIDDPLKTGHVVCGNVYVHGELVKILKPLG